MKWGAMALILVACTGCSVTVPIGQAGRFGAIHGSVYYVPPAWDILSNQPQIGGLAK